MTAPPILGVVVVGFNSDDLWPRFFEALETSSIKPQKVVVVENSQTQPQTIPSNTSFEVEVLHLPENPGYGSAVNKGVRLLPSGISHFCIANADTIVDQNTLKALISAQNRFPHTGALGPAIETSHGNIYPSARSIPGVRLGIGHALFGAIWPTNPWTKSYLGDYSLPDIRPVGWLSGSFLLLSREAFDSVKGFDEGYFMFFEDVDICFRLKKKGWRSVYVPTTRVRHIGGHSTSAFMPQMVKAHHDSARRFLGKLYPSARYAPLRAVLTLGLVVRSEIASRYYSRKKPA